MNFLWLIKKESYKSGLVLSVIFNILAKGALFVLTICIAAYFGTDIKTDIYFFIYSSMVLLSGFINTIDTMVLIPESMRLREKHGELIATGFLNYFFRIYALICLLFIASMFLFGTKIFLLFSRFTEADVNTYRNYFLLGSFYFPFQVLTGFMNNILTSLKYFTVPMIISGINSCIVISGIILLHRQFDVLSVFVGGIVAYGINLIILLLILKKAASWDFFVSGARIQKKVWGNILFAEMGQLATLASSFFPLYLLSGFGQGTISVMNYGKNIADIPNTLVTSQLANVSGIKLNEQYARKDTVGMNETFLRMSRLLVVILVPLGCYLFVFAKPVVALFYQSGNFNTETITDTARFLQLLAVTLFCIGINAMVSRVFIALQAIRQAFVYQVIINIFLIGAIWVFTKYFGAYGYPYGIIAVNGLNFILLYFVSKRLARYINYGSLLTYTFFILLLNVAIATGLYFIFPYLPALVIWQLLTGFLIYGTALWLLHKIFPLQTGLGQLKQYLKLKFG